MNNNNCVVLLVLFTLFHVNAQVTNSNFSKDSTDRKDWSFSISPYALLASQATDVGGEKIRQSFGDLASLTNAGFQFVSTVKYKKFSLSFDGTFATLGLNETQGPLMIDVEIVQNIFDLKGAYVIYETFEMKDNRIIDGWSIEFLSGAKYFNTKLNLNYAILIADVPILEDELNVEQEWWDLMLGARTTISLSKSVLLMAQINVGGFGIGNSSQTAFDFTYLNSFRVSRMLAVNAGFRTFRYKRVDGEGDEELTTRLNVLGPFLGVSFIFN